MKRQGTPRSVQEIADAVGARLIGDGSRAVSGVASIGSAGPDDLVFVEDEKYLAAALQSHAGALIAPPSAASKASSIPLLISDHPKLAFARAARLLGEAPATDGGPRVAGVHPTAVIGAEVEIGDNTQIGAGCVLADGVRIGRDCQIYPNVTIYSSTTLGDRVIVHAGAVLGSDGFGYVQDRKTGRYENFPQVGALVIEDDVEIGANSTVDRGALDETRIRRGTKIDNLVHVGHNCQIGEDVVIAAQTGLSGSVVIENGAVLGGQVGIADHARVGEGVLVGAQCGILPYKVLRGKGVPFWGTPARPLREYLRQLATLARMAKKD